MAESEVAEVISLPRQCEVIQDDDSRCKSRNAVWNEKLQMNVCFVHEAALEQAKAKHPAGKALPATRPLMVRECADPDCRRCR